MGYIISKQFSLCYGHRVWTQKINQELSCNGTCACRHLHGHQGEIIVHLSGDEVDERGMFLDFKELEFFKKFVDNVLDHKMILDINDPIVPQLLSGIVPPESIASKDNYYFLLEPNSGYFYLREHLLSKLSPTIREVCEGYVFVPFVPTSENLAKWLHGIVQEKLNPFNVKVSRIQFFETPKSQSNYIA